MRGRIKRTIDEYNGASLRKRKGRKRVKSPRLNAIRESKAQEFSCSSAKKREKRREGRGSFLVFRGDFLLGR